MISHEITNLSQGDNDEAFQHTLLSRVQKYNRQFAAIAKKMKLLLQQLLLFSVPLAAAPHP